MVTATRDTVPEGEEYSKVDHHNRQHGRASQADHGLIKRPHNQLHTPNAHKLEAAGASSRLDRHPGDGNPIHAGPKKGGGGGGWGQFGEEVGGFKDIHSVADLDAQEEALAEEGATGQVMEDDGVEEGTVLAAADNKAGVAAVAPEKVEALTGGGVAIGDTQA